MPSNVLGIIELRYLSRIISSVLKTDSEVTVDDGMDKKPVDKHSITGNLTPKCLHHSSVSDPSSSTINSSFKSTCNSFFSSTEGIFKATCFLNFSHLFVYTKEVEILFFSTAGFTVFKYLEAYSLCKFFNSPLISSNFWSLATP